MRRVSACCRLISDRLQQPDRTAPDLWILFPCTLSNNGFYLGGGGGLSEMANSAKDIVQQILCLKFKPPSVLLIPRANHSRRYENPLMTAFSL